MTDHITESLWQEAERHLRAFEQLARRTVEEAWLAGDALLRIKQQLPHGAWTPALKERGIAVRSARRFIQLRQKYPENGQLGRFDSVTAALTDKKAGKSGGDSPTKTAPVTAYLVSADDLWDWERGEVSTLARRLLSDGRAAGIQRQRDGRDSFPGRFVRERRVTVSWPLHDATAAIVSREHRTAEGRPQRNCRNEAATIYF